ncbi:large subunit of N,N-dimethylformamidase [Intrasporangium mesophilum]
MDRILGYVQPISVRPGADLEVNLSGNPSVIAPSVVRLHGPDTAEHEDAVVRRVLQTWGREPAVDIQPQPLRPGSYMHASMAGLGLPELGFSLWAMPTLHSGEPQTLMAGYTETMSWLLQLVDTRLRLSIAQGGASAPDGLANHSQSYAVDLELRATRNRWIRIVGGLAPGRGEFVIAAKVGSTRRATEWRHERARFSALPSGPMTRMALAAHAPGTGGPPEQFFNGRLDRPAIYGHIPTSNEIRLLEAGSDNFNADHPDARLAWDFSKEMDSHRVVEVRRGNHGHLANRPTRAVRSHDWEPGNQDFRVHPELWSAIHFHEDDLDDAGWATTYSIKVPPDTASGVYAVDLGGAASELLPFYVLPSGDPAQVLFLAPTNTYLAYGNEHLGEGERGQAHQKMMASPIELNETDGYVHAHPELGLSLYDRHSDGSGVTYASWRRPILNFHPDYRTWLNAGRRHFAADFYITGWLESLNIPFDVMTDADLHQEGVESLSPYSVVITGTHPEYPSTPELDALSAYVARGGNLMYLGGNGFYWVTAFSPDGTDVVECRRGFAAQRNWSSEPGEVHLSFTGEPGGAHIHLGRTPRSLVGVLSVAAGWGAAGGYRRGKDADDVTWAFDGVSPGVIGTNGLVLGGAAGDEVDSADYDAGTPPEARVLLTSTNLGPKYYPFLDAVLAVEPGQSGMENQAVRSDVVLIPGAGGSGSVFSAGSICWAGAMAWRGYSNDISRLTENVLMRFMATRDRPETTSE